MCAVVTSRAAFSPEDAMALVRAAASEQDAAIYLTAGFTGLRRGEPVALRWCDVDFARRHVRVTASYTERSQTTPKSGGSGPCCSHRWWQRSSPVWASANAFTGEDDLAFPGIAGTYLDASALYRRYKTALRRAGLRDLRFHDLRHTFGMQAIGNPRVSILQLKEWMGHADIDTTKTAPQRPVELRFRSLIAHDKLSHVTK
jgi:integrase